jgi:hypothetical protein
MIECVPSVESNPIPFFPSYPAVWRTGNKTRATPGETGPRRK